MAGSARPLILLRLPESVRWERKRGLHPAMSGHAQVRRDLSLVASRNSRAAGEQAWRWKGAFSVTFLEDSVSYFMYAKCFFHKSLPKKLVRVPRRHKAWTWVASDSYTESATKDLAQQFKVTFVAATMLFRVLVRGKPVCGNNSLRWTVISTWIRCFFFVRTVVLFQIFILWPLSLSFWPRSADADNLVT